MESKKKKLVFLTSRFPYPLNKGDKLRVFYQLKTLSVDFEIDLICIDEKEVPQNYMAAVAPFCNSIKCYVLPKYKRVFSIVSSFWKGTPLQVAYFYNKKIERDLQNRMSRFEPDYIHCHLIRTTEYVKGINGIPKALDFMDAYASGMGKRESVEKNPFKKCLYRYEKKRLASYETQALEYTDRYCIISKQDREAILNPKSKSMAIVPNGVDFEQFFPREDKKEYDLVFMGNMSYPPNQIAIKFLIEKIMPLVLKERPLTTLLIAGVGSSRFEKYRNKNIQIIEHFKCISDSIACSRIMVAPMRISIGLQNKIIQALAMKVPCIVSSSANKPIGAIAGTSIMLADSASEFSLCILNLLNDQNKREELAMNGYEFVKNNFSWPKQSEILKRLIQS